MRLFLRYLPIILGLFVLLISLPLTLYLVRQRQEIRKEAAVSGGVGKVTLNPQTVTKYPGDRFSTIIKFRTGTTEANALPISSVSLRITYPYSEVTPELDVVDPNGNPSNQIYPDSDLLSSGDWSFPIKSVTRAGGVVTIDLAAVNTNIAGYKTHLETPLATIYFKTNRVPTTNPIALRFDLGESKMMTKGNPPQDILENPVDGSYTIQPRPATLSFGFKLQGINSSGVLKSMAVTIKYPPNSSRDYTGISFRSDANGVFTPPSPFTLTDFPLPSGGLNVDVLVKDNNHLRKKLGSITLTSGDNLGPSAWQQVVLKAGDFNNDNILNITDIGKLLTVYAALSVPVNPTNQIYDVDSNSVINIADIAIVLTNYTTLTVPGD